MRAYVPLLLIVVFAVLWFVFVSEPASRWFAHVTSRSSYNGAVVGRVVRAEGSVRIVHGNDITIIPSPTNKPVEFRDGDQLQSSVDSKAIVVLNSEDEFEVGSGALLQFQLWNSQDPASAVYIRHTLGQLTLRRSGVRGKAFVVKDGRLYLLGQKPLAKAMALTVLRSAPLDLALANESGPDASAVGAQVSDTGVNAKDPASATPSSLNPDTLSNEYIDETISSRQSQLQKCWLTRLKDAPGLKGQIILQFEISRRGLVKELRVADSSLTDVPLQKCVMSVFERITFRQFKGAEISLSYPIQFE